VGKVCLVVCCVRGTLAGARWGAGGLVAGRRGRVGRGLFDELGGVVEWASRWGEWVAFGVVGVWGADQD